MLKHLGARAIVKPLEAEEESAGGIILPETAQERPREGRVVAVGQPAFTSRTMRRARVLSRKAT